MSAKRLGGLLIAPALMLTLSGCITINTGSSGGDATPSSTPRPQTSSSESTGADYSGALNNLGSAIGALAKSSTTAATPEDCSYTGYVASQMSSSTPAPAWQGTFETIRSNMNAVAQLCAIDPASVDAADLAKRTREDVVKIMNDENYLGLSNWS
jgi:hypothetical protein